jgi:hypothetical protein
MLMPEGLPPKDKVVGYVALTIIAMIVIGLVLTIVLGAIMGLFFVGSMSGIRF